MSPPFGTITLLKSLFAIRDLAHRCLLSDSATLFPRTSWFLGRAGDLSRMTVLEIDVLLEQLLRNRLIDAVDK